MPDINAWNVTGCPASLFSGYLLKKMFSQRGKNSMKNEVKYFELTDEQLNMVVGSGGGCGCDCNPTTPTTPVAPAVQPGDCGSTTPVVPAVQPGDCGSTGSIPSSDQTGSYSYPTTSTSASSSSPCVSYNQIMIIK